MTDVDSTSVTATHGVGIVVTIRADGRVLAAIDGSASAAGVIDHAAWAATRLSARLDLLHAIARDPSVGEHADLSGSLALDNREALLESLAARDEQHGKTSQRDGRALLDAARTRARSATGTDAHVHLRHDSLLQALLDSEAGVRLFVVGAHGERTGGSDARLGDHLQQVLRSVHRPVLVTPAAFRPVQRVVIAFDGSDTARRSVALVCASPLLAGLACDLLCVGSADSAAARAQPWALERLTAAGFAPMPHRIDGAADAVIVELVAAQSADLLVMGAYGHSRLRRLVMGSTTTQVLRAARVPVLLLR